MINKAVKPFIKQISEVTGIDSKLVNAEKAETLWRLLQRHGIRIPVEIDEDVCRYLNGEYPKEAPRRHTSTSVMESLGGDSIIGKLLGLFRHEKEVDYALSCLLREPSIRDYLTRS